MEMNALGVETDGHALFFEEGFDGGRDVFVFARDEAGGFFDDGDFAAEAAEDLGEFEADVTAAYDDEMTWQSLELEDANVVHPWNDVGSGKIGDDGAASDVEEDFFRGEEIVADTDLIGRPEVGVAGEDGAILHAAQIGFEAIAGVEDDLVFAGFDGLHVYRDCAW